MTRNIMILPLNLINIVSMCGLEAVVQTFFSCCGVWRKISQDHNLEEFFM